MQRQNLDHVAAVVVAVIVDLMADDGAAPIESPAAIVNLADEMLFGMMQTANVKTHFLRRWQRFGTNRANEALLTRDCVKGETVDESLSRSGDRFR